MKLNQVILTVLLIGLFACRNSNNKIIVQGEITGEIPEKIEYTNPIHGICNWNFTKSVQPDSLGKFQIEITSNEAIFIKLGPSYTQQGTLIAEPGKIYNIRFNLNDKENIFSVTDKSSTIQEAYKKFPNPEHIQDGAREFLRDTTASQILETINQRRTAEIAEFEKLYSNKLISGDVFEMVKTDRNCYYDAVLATVAWIKDLITIRGRENVFTKEFENLWKKTFKQPLFSNPEIVKSQWFNFYAESYIYFQEFVNGNFTKEKLEALRESNQTNIYFRNKAKEYLPATFCENYLANYLYEKCLQKEYEKELIELFNDFKTDYPESDYIPYISPSIDEVIEYHKKAESGFSEKTKFVKDYQNLNTLTEIVKTLPPGKIYVDVWATWCGPCKAEFAHKKELDSLLQNKGIQKLYISVDRDQDSVQWKNMIKFYNLEGFHVRANKELDTELRKIFDRQGTITIPWYILMDSNGKILKKHASKPSQISELEKEINM
jgi:thiol-disulfide isomerase/thioredoxin